MNETHDPEMQMVMGFMAWLGDQSHTSPGAQPQGPLFCLRASCNLINYELGLRLFQQAPLVRQNIVHLGF